MPINKFEDELYGVRIYFVFNETVEKLNKIINLYIKKYKTRGVGENPLKDAGALKIRLDFSNYLVLLSGDNSTAVADDLSRLSHELFHVIYHAFHDRGFELNGGSEEAYAYYLQFWFKKLFKCYLNEIKKNKKVKRSIKNRK